MSTGSTPSPAHPALTADHLALAAREARHKHRRYPDLTLSAEDLEGEAYLALLESLAKHGDTRSHLITDVRCHLHRVVVAELRRHKPLPLVGDIIDPRTLADTPELSPEEWTDAMECLTTQQRLVIALTRDGYSDSEIASQIGTTDGAVRVARHEAIGRLRDLLTGK